MNMDWRSAANEIASLKEIGPELRGIRAEKCLETSTVAVRRPPRKGKYDYAPCSGFGSAEQQQIHLNQTHMDDRHHVHDDTHAVR